MKASGTEGSQGVDRLARVTGPSVVGVVAGLAVTAGIEETHHTVPPDKPLLLVKWADKQSAQVGDVVTFFLKYSNLGGRPITDVAVSDSLTGRLEYVTGSAHSNRAAVFTTRPNEAGSVILHWEMSGTLPPGEMGIVSFQAIIR